MGVGGVCPQRQFLEVRKAQRLPLPRGPTLELRGHELAHSDVPGGGASLVQRSQRGCLLL